MKHNDYISAVNKLKFSNDLAERVRAVDRATPRFRVARTAVLAAVITVLMATSVFGAVSFMREKPSDVDVLGTDTGEMEDALWMEFSVGQQTEGVEVHYMELDPIQNYSLRHGMLVGSDAGYLRITADYQLESVPVERFSATLEKNNRIYTFQITYLNMGNRVISNYKAILHKDENGEILLNATDGNSEQWPVYWNVDAGTIRDALPGWTAEDFEGRISCGDSVMDGILISALVEGDEMVDCVADGQVLVHRDASSSLLYWIADGASEPKMIEVPKHCSWFVEDNTIYYQNQSGYLYRMDENLEFVLISEYETCDDFTNGLLTVNVGGKLGILDAFTGDTFVFNEISVSPWELDELYGYNAVRYGNSGIIALVQTNLLRDEGLVALCSLGVLDVDQAELKMLEIGNSYDGFQNGWLDENRFGVIYKSSGRQYLCIYEFTA